MRIRLLGALIASTVSLFSATPAISSSLPGTHRPRNAARREARSRPAHYHRARAGERMPTLNVEVLPKEVAAPVGGQLVAYGAPIPVKGADPTQMQTFLFDRLRLATAVTVIENGNAEVTSIDTENTAFRTGTEAQEFLEGKEGHPTSSQHKSEPTAATPEEQIEVTTTYASISEKVVQSTRTTKTQRGTLPTAITVVVEILDNEGVQYSDLIPVPITYAKHGGFGTFGGTGYINQYVDLVNKLQLLSSQNLRVQFRVANNAAAPIQVALGETISSAGVLIPEPGQLSLYYSPEVRYGAR